jgi:hypothetical protein
MPRTPLATRLSGAAAVAAESHDAGLTRRQLLAGGAALATAAALSRVPSARAAGNPRIVVIGGRLPGVCGQGVVAIDGVNVVKPSGYSVAKGIWE